MLMLKYQAARKRAALFFEGQPEGGGNLTVSHMNRAAGQLAQRLTIYVSDMIYGEILPFWQMSCRVRQ